MPTPYRRGQTTHPTHRHTLRQASDLGQLIVVSCGLCRRTATFLAADVLAVWGPDCDARDPPIKCSACGKDEYLSVKLRLPTPNDSGRLVLRRPDGLATVQRWRNDVYK